MNEKSYTFALWKIHKKEKNVKEQWHKLLSTFQPLFRWIPEDLEDKSGTVSESVLQRIPARHRQLHRAGNGDESNDIWKLCGSRLITGFNEHRFSKVLSLIQWFNKKISLIQWFKKTISLIQRFNEVSS